MNISASTSRVRTTPASLELSCRGALSEWLLGGNSSLPKSLKKPAGLSTTLKPIVSSNTNLCSSGKSPSHYSSLKKVDSIFKFPENAVLATTSISGLTNAMPAGVSEPERHSAKMESILQQASSKRSDLFDYSTAFNEEEMFHETLDNSIMDDFTKCILDSRSLSDELVSDVQNHVQQRADSYYSVVQRHMPERFFQGNIQNSVKKLLYRLRLVDGNPKFIPWLLDFFALLALSRNTNYHSVEIVFPSVQLHTIFNILAITHRFQFSDLISSIVLPSSKINDNAVLNYKNSTSKWEDIVNVLSTFRTLSNLNVKSRNPRLLKNLKHLSLESLTLSSSQLSKKDIVETVSGTELLSKAGFSTTPLVNSLKSLSISNSTISLSTYCLLVRTFPNLIHLAVQPQLGETFSEDTLPRINVDQWETTQENKFCLDSKVKYLTVNCDHLVSHQLNEIFPQLKHLTIEIYQEHSVRNLSSLETLENLESLNLCWNPSFDNSYKNLKFDMISQFFEENLDQFTSLSLSQFDISPDSFILLSSLSKLKSLSLKNCWLNPPKEYEGGFQRLTEFCIEPNLTEDVAEFVFSGGSVQHLAIQSEKALHGSQVTENSIQSLILSGKLQSLVSLSLKTNNISSGFMKFLGFLPKLQKFTSDTKEMSSEEVRKYSALTPSRITLCSEA